MLVRKHGEKDKLTFDFIFFLITFYLFSFHICKNTLPDYIIAANSTPKSPKISVGVLKTDHNS